MVKLDLQYDIVNDSPASATPVEANFNRTEQFLNQELLNRDGTVAMLAPLHLFGDPVNALDAAPKQYVDSYMPIGSIVMFGGTSSPAGGKWLLCNGADLQQSAYPALYAAIGNAYTPSGSPAGHFNLPNLAGRFPLGVSANPGIGSTGGNRDGVTIAHSHDISHTHAANTTGDDTPDHLHIGTDHAHGVNINTGGVSTVHRHPIHGSMGAGTGSNPFGLGLVGDPAIFGAIVPSSGEYENHIHNVSGNTGGVDRTMWTSGAGINSNNSFVAARHRHPTPALSFTGTTATSGVPATDANLPPYVVVNFIMRVL